MIPVRVGDIVKALRPVKRGIITYNYARYGTITNIMDKVFYVQLRNESGVPRVEKFTVDEIKYIRAGYEETK